MTIKEYEKLWADDVITRMQCYRPYWDNVGKKMYISASMPMLDFWYRDFAHLCAENIDLFDDVVVLHDLSYGNFLHHMQRIRKEYQKICRLRDSTSMMITVWTLSLGEDDMHPVE